MIMKRHPFIHLRSLLSGLPAKYHTTIQPTYTIIHMSRITLLYNPPVSGAQIECM